MGIKMMEGSLLESVFCRAYINEEERRGREEEGGPLLPSVGPISMWRKGREGRTITTICRSYINEGERKGREEEGGPLLPSVGPISMRRKGRVGRRREDHYYHL